MLPMRLDHLSFAAGPDGLASTAQRIGGLLGTEFVDGGVHPRFGTRNRILPLAGNTYMEIVEVLDHPASDKAPFGQVVRARSEAGGGWLACHSAPSSWPRGGSPRLIPRKSDIDASPHFNTTMCGFAGVVAWDDRYRVSRETLSEVRGAVEGYRGSGLSGELHHLHHPAVGHPAERRLGPSRPRARRSP